MKTPSRSGTARWQAGQDAAEVTHERDYPTSLHPPRQGFLLGAALSVRWRQSEWSAPSSSTTGYSNLRMSPMRDGPSSEVRRMILAARCLGLSPVFIDASDDRLVAEIFDGHGDLSEVWTWRLA